MLHIAGYTIDRIVRVDEEAHAELELASGIACIIPGGDVKSANLLAWAKDMFGFHAPIALRIVDGVAVDAVLHRYTKVLALSPEGERPVKVNLCGESGTFRFSRPEAEDECYLRLAASLASGRELLFLLGSGIEAAVELSPSQIANFREMSSHPSPIEHPLSHHLPCE